MPLKTRFYSKNCTKKPLNSLKNNVQQSIEHCPPKCLLHGWPLLRGFSALCYSNWAAEIHQKQKRPISQFDQKRPFDKLVLIFRPSQPPTPFPDVTWCLPCSVTTTSVRRWPMLSISLAFPNWLLVNSSTTFTQTGWPQIEPHQVYQLAQFLIEFQLFATKKIIDLPEGQINGLMCRGDAFLFCSSQQLSRLCLGPLKGFLSWHGALQGPPSRLMHCFWNYRETRTPSGVPC